LKNNKCARGEWKPGAAGSGAPAGSRKGHDHEWIIIDCTDLRGKKTETADSGQLWCTRRTPVHCAGLTSPGSWWKRRFIPLDPETAQFHLPVEKYAAILSDVKPRFHHAPESKKTHSGECYGPRIQLAEDVVILTLPRMRSWTTHDFLTSGIA